MKTDTKLKLTKFSVIVLLIILALFISIKRQEYVTEQGNKWANEQWEKLIANSYESFETEGYLIEYIPELNDMRIVNLNK